MSARRLALALLVAAGCASNQTLPPQDATSLDTGVPDAGPAGDTGVVVATDAPPADAAPADTAGGYYASPGFTLTPFLSEEPVRRFAAAEQVLQSDRDYRAVLETDAGRMVVDLAEISTPITVNSFVFLARNHYFDGIAFHRVIDGFVVQGGDPNTLDETSRARWGTGGPGYQFGLEIRDDLRFDDRGMVGMARSSNPNSNGSQFYITLAATPTLNGQYTVFGRVVEGLDVLDRVARGQPPATPSRMTRVYIIERGR